MKRGRVGALVGRGRPDVLADARVSLGAADGGWPFGRCWFVVSVGGTGPVRVEYTMVEPVGPRWVRLVEPCGHRRRRVLLAGLECAGLIGPGRQVGGVEESAEQAAPGHGWVQVTGGGESLWADLPADGRIRGVDVFGLMVRVVPGKTWRELHARRDEAWRDWERASRGGPGACAGESDPDETVPDGRVARGLGGDVGPRGPRDTGGGAQ